MSIIFTRSHVDHVHKKPCRWPPQSAATNNIVRCGIMVSAVTRKQRKQLLSKLANLPGDISVIGYSTVTINTGDEAFLPLLLKWIWWLKQYGREVSTAGTFDYTRPNLKVDVITWEDAVDLVSALRYESYDKSKEPGTSWSKCVRKLDEGTTWSLISVNICFYLFSPQSYCQRNCCLSPLQYSALQLS